MTGKLQKGNAKGNVRELGMIRPTASAREQEEVKQGKAQARGTRPGATIQRKPSFLAASSHLFSFIHHRTLSSTYKIKPNYK